MLKAAAKHTRRAAVLRCTCAGSHITSVRRILSCMNIYEEERARRSRLHKIKYIIYNMLQMIKRSDKTGTAAVAGCMMLLLSPQISVAAARKGMELWWSTVVPSLLPFFIFTDMLMAAGVHRVIGRALSHPVSFLLGVPGEAAFVFASSILSGYPTGARLTAELRRSGSITQDQARDMLNFCSTSGPLFIVGAVGTGMLNDCRAGYMILAAHCTGAIATGMIMNPGSLLNRRDKQIKKTERIRHLSVSTAEKGRASLSYDNTTSEAHRIKSNSTGVMQAATDAVLRSLKTIGLIGGFIIIFTIITEYAARAGDAAAIAIASRAPGAQTAASAKIAEIINYITTAVSGMLEMTVGCSQVCSMQEVGINIKTTLCAFLVSFGGLSVTAQTAGVLRGTDISMSHYIRAKLMHGLISAALTVTMIFLQTIK